MIFKEKRKKAKTKMELITFAIITKIKPKVNAKQE